jgi:hypothetical protein
MLGYIKARDAAARSGYTQDYIGQLIRRGKIRGKKIDNEWYLNLVSFVCYVKKYNPEIKLPFNPLIAVFCKYKVLSLFIIGLVIICCVLVVILVFEPYRRTHQLETGVIQETELGHTVIVTDTEQNIKDQVEITALPDGSGEVFISIDAKQ